MRDNKGGMKGNEVQSTQQLKVPSRQACLALQAAIFAAGLATTAAICKLADQARQTMRHLLCRWPAEAAHTRVVRSTHSPATC